jgi:nitrile hydratase subunit alpha
MDESSHSERSDVESRVRALESLLTEKGYVDPAAIDALVEAYETRIGPHNGAQVVAKAWTDAKYAAWLRDDATAAVSSLGFLGTQGEHVRAVENTETEHNMVVCTLCSCYPWPLLGLPQSGTNRRHTGHGPWSTHAAFLRTSGSSSRRPPGSGSGTRPQNCATW